MPKRPSTGEILAVIEKLEKHLNESGYIPATRKEFVEYIAKTQEYTLSVAAKHYPEKVLPTLDDSVAEMAKKYRSPHSWF